MSATFVQWRAWIGPRSYTQLSTFATGGYYPAANATTLAAPMASGATAATLTDPTGYPAAAGWAWLGPNGAGEAWEYVDYSSLSGADLTGCSRESATGREHNGSHSAGAAARLWWPLDTALGTLTLNERSDANGALIDWTASLRGVAVPQVALRNRHCVIIEIRQSSDPFFLYAPWLIGYLRAPRLKDDANRRGEWQVELTSAFGQWSKISQPGIRAGSLDLARLGSAQATQELAHADKERASGDYTAAAPDFGAGSAIDGSAATLYLAERVIGTPDQDLPDLPDPLNYGSFASQIHIWPAFGEPAGYRWIEWHMPDKDHLVGCVLHNKDGAGASIYFGTGAWIRGQRVVICEDRKLFSARNPLATPVKLYEIGASFFAALDLTDDCLAIYDPARDEWSQVVSWGSANRARHIGAPDVFSETWPDTPLAVPAPGQTIRYSYGPHGERADLFQIDNLDHAGYYIEDFGGSSATWVAIALPPIDVLLRDDVTAGSPAAAAALYLVDAAGHPTTDGLPASGTVQIGSEQLTYSAKIAGGLTVTARGANGTTAASHQAGDPLYVLDGSAATRGPSIREVGWTRRAGGIYPLNFGFRTSTMDSPRTPAEDGDEDDWTSLVEVAGHATDTGYTFTLSPPQRFTHLLFEMGITNLAQARARVNTITALADESAYDPAYWLTSGATPGALIEQLLVNVGAPAAIFTDMTATVLSDQATAEGETGKISADLADATGTRIIIDRASLITLAPHDLWTAPPTSTSTWTRANARSAEQVQTINDGIVQIALKWRTATDPTEQIARYPDPPSFQGAGASIGPYIYPDAATALAAAQRRYQANRYGYTYVIECAQGEPDARPGQIHTLTWQFASDMQPLSRTLYVTGVDHQFTANAWQTVITGYQLGRERYE